MTVSEWLAQLEEPVFKRTKRVSAKVAAEDWAMFTRAQGILQSG